MTGILTRLAIHTSVATALALASLANQVHAADRRGPNGPNEVLDATPASASDLDALKSKLRATGAIGIPTKLALKFRLTKLVEDFRGFHSGRQQHGLADLHRRFTSLIDETMRLIRNGDTALFRELQMARAGLWQTLVNPVTFAAVAGDSAVTRLVEREFR